MKNWLPLYLITAALMQQPIKGQQAATLPSTQTQQQPCPTTSSSKPSLRIPDKLKDPKTKAGKFIGTWIPFDTTGSSNTNAKPASPCPPAAPNTVVAPVVRPPTGVTVTSVWYCDPIVTAKMSGTNYLMPEDIALASPSSGEYLADTAKPRPGAVKCSSLRRDPATGKVWLPK